jgi:hypothetical protein
MSPTIDTDGRSPLAGTPAIPASVRTVVCYLRTANPGTVGQRHLQRQHTKLKAACADRGWTVVAWIEDLHQSGTILQRPGLGEALALLVDHQADALLAADRCTWPWTPRSSASSWRWPPSSAGSS